MGRSKVAISLDESTLSRLDKLVQKQIFSNRSQAIQEAVAEKLARLEKSRLAQSAPNLIRHSRKRSQKMVSPRIWQNGQNIEGREKIMGEDQPDSNACG
jgi:metal-responsive CopG/Arc/MetJ family transcriptional regulator